MRIAVCDDENISLEYNVDLLENYKSERNLSAEVLRFNDPLKLLKATDAEPIDIYFLDMIMPGMNGIELGKRIRGKNADAQIVFLTADRESALEAYDVNPLHYLIKPVSSDSIKKVMDLALSKLPKPERKITIKNKNGIYSFPIKDIICIEHTQRIAKFTLSNGKSIESMTLSSGFSDFVKSIVNEEGFISPHNSFVVNMDAVQNLEKDGFVLKTGMFVPVAVRKQTAVKSAYLEYCQKKLKNK